jgi:hypothetical protein
VLGAHQSQNDRLLSAEQMGVLDDSLTRAHQWLADRIEYFDPRVHPVGSEEYFTGSKALCELSLLCSITARGGMIELPPALVALPFNVWATPSFAERLATQPHRFRLYGAVYASLRSMGLSDATSDAVIHDLLSDGYITATEEVPYRRLEIRYLLDLAGIDHDLPHYDTLYNETLLARAERASVLTYADAYSVTHTLFYLSDFGLRAPTFTTPSEYARIERLVEFLACRYVAQRHWDLAGEMLLCLGSLPSSDPSVLVFTWLALNRAWNRDGSVSGPWRSGAMNVAQHEGNSRDELFRDNYHTTLVAALAAQVVRRRLARPKPSSSLPRIVQASANVGVIRPRNLATSLQRCEVFLSNVASQDNRSDISNDRIEIFALVVHFMVATLEPTEPRWEHIRRLCEEMASCSYEDLVGTEPTVVLLAREIAHYLHCWVPPLERYRHAVLEALHAPVDALSFPALARAAASEEEVDFTTNEAQHLRKVAADYLTTLVANPVRAHALSEGDRWLISGHIINFLNCRNLEVASLLCRVLTESGPPRDAFRGEVLAGFLSCQHPSGYFGFDSRISELAGEVDESVVVGARTRVTLVTLWAITQFAVQGFKLLDPRTWPKSEWIDSYDADEAAPP